MNSARAVEKGIGRCAAFMTGCWSNEPYSASGWFSEDNTIRPRLWDALWLYLWLKTHKYDIEFYLSATELPTMPHRVMRHWHCCLKEKWYWFFTMYLTCPIQWILPNALLVSLQLRRPMLRSSFRVYTIIALFYHPQQYGDVDLRVYQLRVTSKSSVMSNSLATKKSYSVTANSHRILRFVWCPIPFSLKVLHQTCSRNQCYLG